MKTIFLLTLFMVSCAIGFAQKTWTISGNITDSTTGKSLADVNIKVQGTKTGAISDKKGHFAIQVVKLPATLEISHMGFGSKKINITSGNELLKIQLVPISKEIGEVTIFSKKVINLVEKKLFDVVDYEFVGNNILMLVYYYKYDAKMNPWLVLINTNGDTLGMAVTHQDGLFYKDCIDQIHLVNKEKAWQIHFDEESKNFYLLYPVSAKDFEKALSPCITTLNGMYYIKQSSHKNQVLYYSYVDSKDTSRHVFRIIADSTALKMLSGHGRFLSMSASQPTDADLRFEEMAFYKPVYAPLIKIKDQIYIFNHNASKIENYNNKGELLKNINIKYHLDKNWKEELFTDTETGKIYTLYFVNGKSTLREISLLDGSLGNPIKIPDFKYIKNIKINDNKVYFLYRKALTDDFTCLYKMELKN